MKVETEAGSALCVRRRSDGYSAEATSVDDARRRGFAEVVARRRQQSKDGSVSYATRNSRLASYLSGFSIVEFI